MLARLCLSLLCASAGAVCDGACQSLAASLLQTTRGTSKLANPGHPNPLSQEELEHDQGGIEDMASIINAMDSGGTGTSGNGTSGNGTEEKPNPLGVFMEFVMAKMAQIESVREVQQEEFKTSLP